MRAHPLLGCVGGCSQSQSRAADDVMLHGCIKETFRCGSATNPYNCLLLDHKQYIQLAISCHGSLCSGGVGKASIFDSPSHHDCLIVDIPTSF